MDMENIIGPMEGNLLVTGAIIECMGKVCIRGVMGDNILDHTKMIKNMVKEFTNGLMVKVIMEGGAKEHIMARVNSQLLVIM